MSGRTRPSLASCAFHSLNVASSSSRSSPRPASRTGCAESNETRYWYHEMSHAKVIATSRLTPEKGTQLTVGSPRLFAIPERVRRKVDALNSSEASTTACSSADRRRRIGSSSTGGSAGGREGWEAAGRSPPRGRPEGLEDRGQQPAAAALGAQRRRRRRALLDPAVLERDVLAERADVDEVL